jgi:hypothetical protein
MILVQVFYRGQLDYRMSRALSACLTKNPIPPKKTPTRCEPTRMIASLGGFQGAKVREIQKPKACGLDSNVWRPHRNVEDYESRICPTSLKTHCVQRFGLWVKIRANCGVIHSMID